MIFSNVRDIQCMSSAYTAIIERVSVNSIHAHTNPQLLFLFSVRKKFKYRVEKDKMRVVKSNKKRIAGGQQSECLYAQVIR